MAIPFKILIAVGLLAAGAKTAQTVLEGQDGGHGKAEEVISASAQEPVIQKVDELPEILAAISAEHKALDEKRASVADGQARLDLASAAVEHKIEQLEMLRQKIEGLVQEAAKGESQDVERLVKIYRAMKPDQAGAIMTDMDIEVAVLVLGSMDEKTAGPILANMSVVRAQAVSKIIFERSRLPGNQNLVNVRLN
ncbi:MotE family protein [Paracoccus litorisediminis]|uniref:MotE family protein n=1 Tax=Paracoccus litorisediminis TaxID=2006130 RepID=UPI00372EF4CD